MHPHEIVTPPRSDSPAVVVALLGEVSTRREGTLTPLPGTRARSLLVALATPAGRSRSAQTLIDDVWGDAPPRAPMNALHTQMSRLRAALPDGAIEISPAGYRLTLRKDQVDLALARQLEQHAQQLHAEGDDLGSCAAIRTARTLWRGEPGADLPIGALAQELASEAHTRLAALDAAEIAARRALGDISGALTPARAAAARSPLDEPTHLELMRLLVAANRSTEALDVFASLRSRLAEQLGADPGAALIELNTAILRGDSEPGIGPGAPTPIAVGLRAAPNPLLGRDEDLAALDALLRAARVTTVLGPGGSGKTRVAHELGTRWLPRLPVALVELASLRNGEDLVAAVSSTLGLSEVELIQPGSAQLSATRLHSPKQRLLETLSARPTLLILDNCEHLIDEVAELVADLVGSCERLTVLTTSRAPLMISAESVYPLPPLRVDVHGSPATELFATRARAVRPSARLDPTDVARLCHTLDGLPLAIELAAARVRSMSVAEINSGLSQRFALLRGGDRSSPERHRTLQSVIEWSWNLLDDPQRAALRRLCRFPAGFTMTAATAVAGWDGLDDIESALDGLVNQSLLTVGETPSGVRYHMLETVREFGEERLAEADEVDGVMREMMRWAQDFVAWCYVEQQTERQLPTIWAAVREQENLLAVLRHAIRVPGAHRTVHMVFAALGAVWSMRGMHSEVMAWAPRVHAASPPPIDCPDVEFDYLATSTMVGASHLMFGGDVRGACQSRVRLRALLRARSDGSPAVRLYTTLAVAPHNGQGVARLLVDGTRSDDELSRHVAYSLRAQLRENLGNRALSARDGERALAISVSRGDIWSEAMSSQQLGSLYAQDGRYATSVQYYQRGIDLLGQLLAHDEAGQVRSFLAASLVGAGELTKARQVLDGIETTSHTPATWEATQCQAAHSGALAELLLAEGNIDEGLATYRRTLEPVYFPPSDMMAAAAGALYASATVCAHVLHGQAPRVAAVAEQITQLMSHPVMSKYSDVAQVGAAAIAVAGCRIGCGDHRAETVELLALGQAADARQDFPSLLRSRNLAVARAAVGDAALDAALHRTAHLTKRDAVTAIVNHQS